MSTYLRIREWGEFQHYKDRDPPWIKLHRKLLTSRTWVGSDDASRVLAIALMLLAAGTDNKIPADAEYLKRVAYLNGVPDWMPLVRAGFIDLIDENGESLADASKAQAKRTKSSSEKRREETEQSRGRSDQNPVAQERDTGPVERIFEHWRSVFGHPKAQLDAKRRKVIAAGLRSYDEATLCAALSGYKHSPHHMGQNERRTVYDDITLLLRDSTHIEAGLNHGRTQAERQTWPTEFHQEVVAAYHELLPDLPQVRDWTDQRRRLLDDRIAERVKAGKNADQIGYWRAMFGQVQQSDFLRGRTDDWRCPGLEWMLEPENFLKVIEGAYATSKRLNGAHHAR